MSTKPTDENTERKHRDYDSLIIVILASTVFIILAYIFFLPHHTLQAADSDKTDIANAMMIELNAINNILTWGSFIIASLTMVAAVFGIVGFVEYRKSVDKEVEKLETTTTNFITTTNSKISTVEQNQASFIENTNKTIEKYQNEIKNKIIEIESFKSSMMAQARYFNKSIEYLYMVSSNLIEKDGNEELRNLIYHGLNLMALYQNELDDCKDKPADTILEKIEAIENLKDIGTEDDIKDLKIIAQNEPNEEIRQKIYELIGIIKHKKS